MSKIVKTKDGSHSVYSQEFGENYHSTFGAINESKYVFIESGLKAISKRSIHIFEVGFGTGLNALLTYLESVKNNLKINYTAIELYPLDKNIISKLNYNELLSIKDTDIFKNIHQSVWEDAVEISSNFKLKKINADFNTYKPNELYDIIFFDAFSPETQPELWSFNNFQKLYNSLNSNGILTTYSSKGIVKENLRNAGFKVKRLNGPIGKRHILKAIK